MKLHEGHMFEVIKRVNDGHWMTYRSGVTTQSEAEQAMEYGQSFHAERCPNDRVEWRIEQVY